MANNEKYVLNENIKLHNASQRIELSYGYQDYPIKIIKDGEKKKDTHRKLARDPPFSDFENFS